MIIDLALFFTAEVCLILILYRFLLRQWIVDHWDQKLQEEGWLIVRLEPVIDEIEDRMHEKLDQFQSSFFGSVGAMTKKAKDLDPMNNIRKAAKDGDWTSMLVEYAANKANLGHLLPNESAKNAEKQGVNGNIKPPIPQKVKDFLFK
jgi:hypothetical protein